MIRQYDVIIVGGGPAGSACALALKHAGLNVAIVDKNKFPRDKTCGDAIPTGAIKALQKLDECLSKTILDHSKATHISAARFVNHTGTEAGITWSSKACNFKRMAFDKLLFDQVKKETQTTIFEDTHVTSVKNTSQGVTLQTDQGTFECKLVVACDGAQSVIAKQLASFTVNKKHYCGAVRAYYSNVKNIKPGCNEVFFSKKYFPSYFWIFPVSDHECNVGFGMLSHVIAKQKVNLEQAMYNIIQEFPELRQRFSAATQQIKTIGFGLPLGTRKLKISGNGFLLCGDAASLIDPVAGSGIDHAIISGMLAAEHIISNKHRVHFSEQINKQYDKHVYKAIWKQLRTNTRILRITTQFPFLIGLFIRLYSERSFSGRILRKLF